MNIDIVILAAGKGTRMHSSRPKVLHAIAGKPMVQHVVDTVSQLGNPAINVVVGHEAQQVRETLVGDVSFIEQSEQLGTGHAVAQALPKLRDDALCLILYGDVPLTRLATLQRLCDATPATTMSVLTVTLDDATGYGRIVRDASGSVTSIVEQKDATPQQLEIKEINTGIMAVYSADLKRWLPRLSNQNALGEYYLTDIIAMAVDEGIDVNTLNPESSYEVEGVNNKLQLAALEREFQKNHAEALLVSGVTLADPERIDVRGTLLAGKDCFIDINCVFEGDVTLGNNVEIGPNCVIKDARLGDGVIVHANTVIEESSLETRSIIGPFGRLRPGARLAEGAKVGNFVEIKNSVLGKGSKANHLAYIGDADIGAGCNVGAGTIVCNYDGAHKFKTTMGDNVFIGSNCTLVAPITFADNAFVAAGSTVTLDVSEDELAVGRGKQRNIKGWKRPTKG